MAELSNLAYAVFEVSDLERWDSFATDILGMQAVKPQSGTGLALRMDDYAYRLVLQPGAADDIVAAGWELNSEDDLEAFVAQARAAGAEVALSPELRAARGVEKLYVCADPNGFTHEFFFGPSILPVSQPFKSKVLSGPGFVTGPLGLGHILPVSKDYEVSAAFYQKILGLKISDYIRAEVAPGIVVNATFFHSATGRHHSLATGQFPAAKILNHFMIQLAHMDDVGMAYDRARHASVPLVLELGHHPNDKMFSFYAQTPSGFAVEIGSGGVVIDDENWKVVTYSQLSDWGHKRVQAPA